MFSFIMPYVYCIQIIGKNLVAKLLLYFFFYFVHLLKEKKFAGRKFGQLRLGAKTTHNLYRTQRPTEAIN